MRQHQIAAAAHAVPRHFADSARVEGALLSATSAILRGRDGLKSGVPGLAMAGFVREQSRAAAALAFGSLPLCTNCRRLVEATLVIALPTERQPARRCPRAAGRRLVSQVCSR